MRVMIREFVELCARTLPFRDPIHEFGAFQVAGQEAIAELRPVFPGRDYHGSDMRPGLGVEILLNLHKLGLRNESIGSALLLDTLEHVEYPHRAMEEVYRILKPDGIVIMSSVMQFPIHSFPDDYWRYTPSAFQSILKPFSKAFVECAGEHDFPHSVIGVGIKGNVDEYTWNRFQSEILIWSRRWYYQTHQPSKLELLAKQLMPPVLVQIYRSFSEHSMHVDTV